MTQSCPADYSQRRFGKDLRMIETHLGELSRFPHRMSGTPQDSQAAGRIREAFDRFGLESSVATFSVPGRLAFGLALNLIFCLAAYLLAKRSFSLALAAYGLSLLSLWGELTFSFHLLRRTIPAHASCNVEAVVPAKGAVNETIVILAHHDSPGTGLLYRGEIAGRLGPRLRRLPAPLNRIYFPPFLGALGLGAALVLRSTAWGRPLSFVIAAVSMGLLVLILFLVLQWGWSRPSPGANDNGSGTAVLLELAERLSRHPVTNVAVRLLATGAEEAGFFGIKHYLKHHPELAASPFFFINLDSVGGGDLYWGVAESALQSIRYPRSGLDSLSGLEAKGGLPVLPRVQILSPTDAGPVAMSGIPVLTLIGLENGFAPPNFHKSSDTFDRLDLPTLNRAADVVERFVRELDISLACP